LTRATLRELELVEGMPTERAQEVQRGLRRLHDYVLRRSGPSA
jgi:DNA integrity scanning protein DisA with diadenylate cyclase activity